MICWAFGCMNRNMPVWRNHLRAIENPWSHMRRGEKKKKRREHTTVQKDIRICSVQFSVKHCTTDWVFADHFLPILVLPPPVITSQTSDPPSWDGSAPFSWCSLGSSLWWECSDSAYFSSRSDRKGAERDFTDEEEKAEMKAKCDRKKEDNLINKCLIH